MNIQKDKNLVGTKVYKYHYHFNDGSANRMKTNTYKHSSYDVLLQNADSIVIEDYEYKVIKTKCMWGSRLIEEPSLLIDIDDDKWGFNIIFDLYTKSPISTSAVKYLILCEIKSKLSSIGEIDLDKLSKLIDKAIMEVVK